MKNFVLIGACGYIAPKHFQAIFETKNNLVAACDVTQNAGIIDKYFPECNFFFNFSSFEKFVKKFQKTRKIDYLVICTPNYLHNKFILFGLKNKINVICEKPLILKTEQLKKILLFEKRYAKKVYCIMQLRLNKKIIKFRKYLINKMKKKSSRIVKCKIKYVTYRGNWFLKTWKGNILKSGGLTTNIGIHLFDLLSWFFGNPIKIKVQKSNSHTSVGTMKFKNAKVDWLISISKKFLNKKKPKERSIRQFLFDDKNLELSSNFTNMHVLSYREILDGNGFKIKDVEKSLYITEKLRKLS
jgi:UDP-N-acetyl-2-amino-2-deoxyglucuronate dehydrogenase